MYKPYKFMDVPAIWWIQDTRQIGTSWEFVCVRGNAVEYRTLSDAQRHCDQLNKSISISGESAE